MRARPAPPHASRYRGEIGTFMWVLHRVTGVLVLGFLFAHVVDTAAILWGPKVYNGVVGLYKKAFVRIFLEVPLVWSVLFHAFNGLRIIAIDLTVTGARRQRELAWGVFAAVLGLGAPATYFMLRPLFVG